MSQVAVRPIAVSSEELEAPVVLRGLPATSLYDRDRLRVGIAYLGAGDLQSTQLPLLIDRYLQTQPDNWMLHAIACAPEDIHMCGTLNLNEGRYYLVDESDVSGDRSIGSIKKMTHALSRPEQAERVLVNPDVRIVAVTMSVAGVPVDALGDLDVNDPSVRNDLSDNDVPVSILGHLFLAAAHRRRMDAPGFAVLSCDDLPRNGDLLATLLLQFAELKDSAVATWIRDNVSFPNSIVDSVLPPVSKVKHSGSSVPDDGRRVVATEPEVQWIIEDRFPNGRPALELVGVQLVENIAPFEHIRNRVLGVAQLALGYIASLQGHSSIAKALNDRNASQLATVVIQEAIRDLASNDQVDVSRYANGVLQRLAKVTSQDSVACLTANGSVRMPTALVPAALATLDRGGDIEPFAFVVATWCRYLRGVDEHGRVVSVDDPLAPQLASRIGMTPNDPAHLLAMTEVFGRRLTNEDSFRRSVAKWLGIIDRLGISNALGHLMDR